MIQVSDESNNRRPIMKKIVPKNTPTPPYSKDDQETNEGSFLIIRKNSYERLARLHENKCHSDYLHAKSFILIVDKI